MITPKNNIVLKLAVAIVIISVFSCAKNEKEEIDLRGPEYYNYKKGNTREYIMDSTGYNWLTGGVKKFTFYIREKITDSFTDLSGRPALRLEQEISKDSGKTYEFYDLQVLSMDQYGLQWVQENQRYLKMALPMAEKKKWNGNLYNNQDPQEYQYTAIGKPHSNPYLNFDDCVFVTEYVENTVISSKQNSAIYAKNYGLAYKLNRNLTYPNLNDTSKVNGYIIEWRLKKFDVD